MAQVSPPMFEIDFSPEIPTRRRSGKSKLSVEIFPVVFSLFPSMFSLISTGTIRSSQDICIFGQKFEMLVPSLNPNGVSNRVPISIANPEAWLLAIDSRISLRLPPIENLSVKLLA